MLWIVGLTGAAVALILGIRYVTGMPGQSYSSPVGPLGDEELELKGRLERHVYVLAGEIGERNLVRKSGLDRAATYIEKTLAGSGCSVRSHPYDVGGATVRNLDTELPGTTKRDEIVLVGAHYDSVPGCPGANDNGTGVAAVLELARIFSGRSFARTMRFAAFVNEEAPYFFTRRMGSRVYARACRARGERIVAMFSLETIGCYFDHEGSQRYPFPFGLFYPRTGNFIAFVGNMSSRALVRRAVGSFRRHTKFPSEGAAAPGYLPGIYWSDHWAFWREGYPAVMVSDTAPFRYPYYHTSDDTPDKIDYRRTARVVVGLGKVVEELAG